MNVTLPLNQKYCLRLPGHKVVLHHPQSLTISVSPLRERGVDQSHQLNRKLWVGHLLGKEADLGHPKNLMGNPVHPLRKEVNQILLQILKLRLEHPLGRGVTLDHLQRLIANLGPLPGLAHLLK